ncbi:hypothetical protein EYR40_000356 [Pleurotus pulmonarius]|nr:hypothetical protein EYR36_001284 [Pleurotus pulmonarius]KAF4603206.1 hypothetical protein EYR38_003616 [Pleurotus pulmonarius]KAF4608015.1 hypothetical protein EYR40_000356 [Pleurotus pulmonarius]
MKSPLAVLALLPIQCLAQYSLVRDYSGSGFFDEWNFFGNADNLTSGDSFYLDRSAAASQKLAFVNDAGNAVIRVDNFTNVALNDKRNSIRVESKDLYDVGSLWIIDAVHIPFGCSVWPAFWSKGDNWPFGGEIDIIEGINRLSRNQIALHTVRGCTKFDAPGEQVGQTLGKDCSIGAGCVTAESKPNSYGQAFADNGGGVFATQFDTSGVYVWYWPRSAIPASIRSASRTNMTLADWGLPTAAYPSNSCDIPKFFTAQRLVLNIALCGVWAGVPNIYKSTCGDGICYNDNVVGPGSPRYDNAYFEIPYIRTYTATAAAVIAPTSTSTSTVIVTQSATPTSDAQNSPSLVNSNSAPTSGAQPGGVAASSASRIHAPDLYAALTHLVVFFFAFF